MAEVTSERLVKVEERGKSNTHRIDRLENLAEAIHRQNENTARLAEKLETIDMTIEALEKRLSEIERQPKTKLNAFSTAFVTALASAVFSMIATLLLS